MTNRAYIVAEPSDDWALVFDSFARAENALLERDYEDELVYAADAVEVDADTLTASVSMVLVDMGATGAFIKADSFDTFEDFRDEVDYQLNEAVRFYGIDAHAYALSNVERYKVVKSLARC